MSTYIIAIGGTGARLAEAIIHLAAAGVFIFDDSTLKQEDLHIFFIDPDSRNGNLAAAEVTALDRYQRCYQATGSGVDQILWMRTRTEHFASWSPCQEAGTLSDIFRCHNLDPSIRNLFDVLYTQEEQNMDLRDGFRGRPAVGSGVMTRFIQNEQSWERLINRIQGGDKVFLCGSIFGGTGASGFPTLARLLTRHLENQGRIRPTVKLGGLLMLPYFSFDPPAEPRVISARPEEFILRTQAALRYYGAHHLGLDTVYLLGIPRLTRVQGDHQPGGEKQCNPPHFLELYGALALRDFLSPENRRPDSLKVVHTSRRSPDSLAWSDIPESKVQKSLKCATRFAFAWSSAIAPDLDHAETNPKDVRWALRFFNPTQLRELSNESNEERRNINAINNWCKGYLQWLLGLHQCDTDRVEWFEFSAFGSLNRGKSELDVEDRSKFVKLVPGEYAGSYLNQILARLRPDSRSQGVVSLARSLYNTIQAEGNFNR